MKQRRQPIKPTMLDRAIGAVSPRWGFKRMQYRQAMNVFEGAGKSRRTKGWRTPDNSINKDTRTGLHTLRARSRHLGQNNAYAAAAHREIPANIVGNGITPHVALPEPEQREPYEALAKQFFDTTACDADGRLNFYGIQNLVAHSVVESGECLVRRIRRPGRPSAARQIPVQFQVLEPDHLDTLKDGMSNGRNFIIQGVEFNPRGQRVAYWLFPDHPGDNGVRVRSYSSERVPAADVLHIFRMDRAGQVRGVPWCAPVLMRLRDFDEYEDAQLYRQKIAACFSVFITPGDQLGFNQSTDEDDESLIPEVLEPGMIEMLGSGKDIKFANPPGVQGYGEYAGVTLHEIATGYGVPYSVLTGDLRQVNFSSGRMGDRAFSRNVSGWQRNLIIPQLCQPVWEWFMEAAIAIRAIDEPAPARWSPPRRELTDPAREIPAIRDTVRSGLITQPEAIRQQGYDPDDFVREMQDWNRQIDDAGLVLDTDPRKVSGAGLTQARPADSELPPTSTGDTDEQPEDE